MVLAGGNRVTEKRLKTIETALRPTFQATTSRALQVTGKSGDTGWADLTCAEGSSGGQQQFSGLHEAMPKNAYGNLEDAAARLPKHAQEPTGSPIAVTWQVCVAPALCPAPCHVHQGQDDRTPAKRVGAKAEACGGIQHNFRDPRSAKNIVFRVDTLRQFQIPPTPGRWYGECQRLPVNMAVSELRCRRNPDL